MKYIEISPNGIVRQLILVELNDQKICALVSFQRKVFITEEVDYGEDFYNSKKEGLIEKDIPEEHHHFIKQYILQEFKNNEPTETETSNDTSPQEITVSEELNIDIERKRLKLKELNSKAATI